MTPEQNSTMRTVLLAFFLMWLIFFTLWFTTAVQRFLYDSKTGEPNLHQTIQMAINEWALKQGRSTTQPVLRLPKGESL